MSNPSSVPRYAWLVVALLWVVALFNYLDRLMITSMREWIVADIPMREANFGLLTSGFLWIYGLVSPVGGFLADRYSRKWVIMVSLTVWSGMMWLTSEMHSFETLLVARAIMGISEACYIAAALALIADYHTGTTRSLATGLHQSGLYVGAALGGAGGWVASKHGWRFTFSTFGAIGVVYGAILLFVLRDRPRLATQAKVEPVALKAAATELATSRSFWFLIAYIGLSGTAFWMINGWLPTFVQERFIGWKPSLRWAGLFHSAWFGDFEVTKGTAGLWATVPMQAASFAGILIGGAWADRWSLTHQRARMLIPTWGFLCAGPCLFLLAITSSFPCAVLAMVAFGLGRGFHDANLMPVVCQVLNPRYCATAYGFLNFMSVTVGGGMIYLSGWLRDRHVGLALPFMIAAAGIFAAGLVMMLVQPKAVPASKIESFAT